MTAAHYKSNLRDIFFNLFEVLAVQQSTFGKGPFAGMDEDTARAALTGLEEFVQAEFATSFAVGDREGAKLVSPGNVVLPAEVTKSLKAFYDGGWNKLELPEHLGGMSAPPSVAWAGFELLAGSNAAATFYLLGNFVARVIDKLGTPSQRERFVSQSVDGNWGGTMVLTEPDAGSDVGAGTTRATHVVGDEYLIEGVKRFITNGDYDLPANILHLVLARPEGARPGTKGLSMFIVPKLWVEPDGSLGERNGCVVTSIEHKLGIKASATCELTLGADTPCRGLLVGEVHDGIAQMFRVIEYARMGVGTKSMATLSTAYLNALAYTKERKQGAELTRAADKTAPRADIIRHPDVRRMLMHQKALAEGLRSLVLWTASIQDQVEIEGGHDSTKTSTNESLNDLLLPLIKGYASEKVQEALVLSLQCFGGSGYCQDYPIEQYLRDQKIDSLYEGTTHIQALDLFFRKVGRDRGATLTALMTTMAASLSSMSDELASVRTAVSTAMNDVQAIFATMLGKLSQSVDHVGLQGNRILFALAELVIGWRLAVSAQVAHEKLGTASETEAAFYRGKLAAARYFASEVLPGVTLARQLVERSELSLMELADDSF